MSRPRVRKAVLSLTDAAIHRLRSLMTSHSSSTHQPVSGIRVGVKTRGCNGLSYTMNYVSPNDSQLVAKDEIVDADDIRVYVDPKALFYVVGSEMDYKDDDISSEFTFKNPNEKGKCGCGESFNV